MLNLRKRSKYARHKPLFILARIVVVVGLLVVLGVLAFVVFGSAYLRVVESPWFCGTVCHSAMGASYESYKKSSHVGIRCAECHSRVGFVDGFLTDTMYAAAREIYVYMEGEEFYNMDELHPKVYDQSCLRSECHKVQTLEEKKSLFMGSHVFTHRGHIPSADEGHSKDSMVCVKCHSSNEDKHMVVNKQACFDCHFGSDSSVSTQRCNSCHSLQFAALPEVTTDETDCNTCHGVFKEKTALLKHYGADSPGYHSAQALGEMKYMLLDKEISIHDKHISQAIDCTSCHAGNQEKPMAVVGGNQVCFDCHFGPDSSASAQNCSSCHISRFTSQPVAATGTTEVCGNCHGVFKERELPKHYSAKLPKHHSIQKSMYQGNVKFVSKNVPSFHEGLEDCTYCHTSVLEKGTISRDKIRQICLDCHEVEDLNAWQNKFRDSVKDAETLLSEVDTSLKSAESKPQEASSLYNEARERIIFVQKDGSLRAHNPELADQLLTDAINKLKKSQQLLR